MKYNKGTFVTVPNIESLDKLPPISQALFMWLCKYADEDGLCYPSRKKLASHLCSTVKTVDNHIKLLIDGGFISKTNRKKENTNENTSNLYQVYLIPDRGEQNTSTRSERNDTVTKPIINSTQLTTITPEKLVNETESVDPSKMALKRVVGVYQVLFRDKYGFGVKSVSFGPINKVLKELLTTYSETQLKFLLMIYFRWKGMNDNDTREELYFNSRTHDIFTFKFNLNKFEAYGRNVLGYNEEFDKEEELKIVVDNFINKLN